MTDTTSIPLNHLTAWDGNVRKTSGADTALAELAASIAAHGLLQSLVVRNGKKGKFAVVAGGRRLQALQQLAESGRIAADYAVPCQVVADDADATEISLAENAVRENMHPADEFEAFRNLSDKGMPAADIAARFGVTEAVVSKRLRLARVSPVILAAYRDGKLDLEQVMAFAITDDHKAQEKLLKVLRNMDDDPRSIRRALTDGEIPASHKVVKFVTLNAYEKAGGQIRRDLFAQDDEGVFILDQELLQTLALAKLEKAADGLRKEGWKWVELRLEQDHSEWSHCSRVHPELAPLTPKLAKKLAALEQEHDTLETAWDANDDPEAEYPERLNEVSDRIDAINETREDVWSPETLAIAGAVVRISYNGKLDIDRGFVLPADRPKKAPATKTVERIGDDGSVETVEVAETPTLPASLIESLTLHKTAAISAELINRPDIALAALVHDLRRLARTDLDRLRQVELIAAAALEQNVIHHREDFRADRHRLACPRFRDQAAQALGHIAVEIARAIRHLVEMRREFRRHVCHLPRIEHALDYDAAVALQDFVNDGLSRRCLHSLHFSHVVPPA